MVPLRLYLQIDFALDLLIRDSAQLSRQALLKELLSSPPEVCLKGREAEAWKRRCHARVEALPPGHFDDRIRARWGPPTVLQLLRSVA